jgi:hypothetical protein
MHILTIKEWTKMAYMNQEKKATISAQVKPIFKKYGIKGSLAVRNYSTIVVNIKSGPLDFIGNANAVQKARCDIGRDYRIITDRYLQVNPYWYQENFTGECKAFFEELFQAVKSAEWYNNSDAMIDYFDTAYYFDVNVGRWDKPYELTN